MAKGIRYTAGAFRLEHCCKHTETHELTGRHESLAEQIEILESLPCTECTILAAELEAEAAAPVVAEVATVDATVAESAESAPVAEAEVIAAVFAGMRRPFVAAEWEGPEHLFNTLSEFCEIMDFPIPTRGAIGAFWFQQAA